MAAAASNIDIQGVTLRLRRSVYAFAVALFAVALLHAIGISSAWLAVAALPFFGAFLMTYQGLFKT
ncbi:MAG: hypothetical protein JNK04_24310 [Myxococcales bacterium]|nr:hypothetical protein [Myxococcales bacterium]